MAVMMPYDGNAEGVLVGVVVVEGRAAHTCFVRDVREACARDAPCAERPSGSESDLRSLDGSVDDLGHFKSPELGHCMDYW